MGDLYVNKYSSDFIIRPIYGLGIFKIEIAKSLGNDYRRYHFESTRIESDR